jgi:hypothetical protein
MQSASFRCETRPFIHLHAGDELVAAVLGTEDRRLALLDVEPVLAQGIDDVGLVRDVIRLSSRRSPPADRNTCVAWPHVSEIDAQERLFLCLN